MLPVRSDFGHAIDFRRETRWRLHFYAAAECVLNSSLLDTAISRPGVLVISNDFGVDGRGNCSHQTTSDLAFVPGRYHVRGKPCSA